MGNFHRKNKGISGSRKIKNNNMVLEEIQKSKFVQINDKRYYFSDSIVSLPFLHPFLKDIVTFQEKKQRNEKYFLEEKQNLLLVEKNALLKNLRRSLLRNILLQKLTYYQIDSLKRSVASNQNINFS